MKKIICLVLCLVLGASILTGCGKTNSIEDILADTSMVIGTVDGQNIYAYEMIYYLKIGNGLEEAKQVLTETKVFQNIADENNIVFNEEMQTQVDEFLTQMETQYGSKENLEAELKNVGVTLDQYVSMLKEALITEAAVNKVVESGVIEEPSEEEIKKYFESNFLKAKHILFTTVGEDGQTALPQEEIDAKTKKAQDTLAAIKAGTPFEDFENLSEDPGSESAPEGYVFVNTANVSDQNSLDLLQNAGVGVMVEGFTVGAASVNPGEVSELITTNYGHHIIKRVALTDADYETYKGVVQSVVTQEGFNIFLKGKVAAAKVEWEDKILETLEANVEPMQATQQ